MLCLAAYGNVIGGRGETFLRLLPIDADEVREPVQGFDKWMPPCDSHFVFPRLRLIKTQRFAICKSAARADQSCSQAARSSAGSLASAAASRRRARSLSCRQCCNA